MSDCEEFFNQSIYHTKFKANHPFIIITTKLLLLHLINHSPAGAAPAAGADPTPDPTLVIMLLRFKPSKALANRPGQ